MSSSDFDVVTGPPAPIRRAPPADTSRLPAEPNQKAPSTPSPDPRDEHR